MDENIKAAQEIIERTNAIYKPKHEYVPADPRDFRRLSLRFYDEARRTLETERFRFMSDEENLTISRSPGGVRTMIRTLLSADGTTTAGLYHFKPGFFVRTLMALMGKGYMKIVDFETEFTDGHFVATSNATSASLMDSPPQIHMTFVPAKTPVLEILRIHQLGVAEYLKDNAGVRARSKNDLKDIHEADDRLNAIKAEFRQKQGGISRDELSRMAGKRNAEEAGEIHDSMVRIQAAERMAAGAQTDQPAAAGQEDTWTLYVVMLDGKPMVVRLLQNARNGTTDLKFMVGVATPLHSPNANGMHDAGEGAELGIIEEAISTALESEGKSKFVLSNCSKGAKEWVFYTRDPEFVKGEFLRIRDASSTHKLQLVIKDDPEWSTYDCFVDLGKK